MQQSPLHASLSDQLGFVKAQTQSTCTCHSALGHTHVGEAIASPAKIRTLTIVLAMILGFAGAELGVGWFSHSLALQAEAGHLFADGGAIVLALGATLLHQGLVRVGRRAQWLEPGAALLNGLGLLAIGGWIAVEAWAHWQVPPQPVLAGPMLLMAIAGLGVNLVNVKLLHPQSQGDLNVRGAFLHVLADLASSLGVIVGAIVIWALGWTWVDSVVGASVAVLIIGSSLPLVWQSLKALRSLQD